MIDLAKKKNNSKATGASVMHGFRAGLSVAGILFGLMFITTPAVSFVLWALSIFGFYKLSQSSKALDDIREYGPLMINHPEYGVSEFSRALKKDREVVIKDINRMLKFKFLFGTLDENGGTFKLDEEYNLALFLSQRGWAEAVFFTKAS